MKYFYCDVGYIGEIQNLVDNELNQEEERHIRAVIAQNKCARACYEELMKQKELLKKWWRLKSAL